MRALSRCIGLSLLVVTGCSSGGSAFFYDFSKGTAPVDLTGQPPPADLTVIQPPPPDFAMQGPPPDFAVTPVFLDMVVVAKLPVGSRCTGNSSCSGTTPQCAMSFGSNPPVPAPGGYCTGTCVNDNDCGNGGVCVGNPPSKICFQQCTLKNQCQTLNPNNRCFFFDATHDVCLPSGISACDPTSSASCGGTGACGRNGFDNTGDCLDTCTFGGTCANDAQGNARNCVFQNARLNVQGQPSGDFFVGLACFAKQSDLPSGSLCTYINDCAPGLECNFYSVGGVGKVCKQLCQKGGACTTGTCQDAFKLGASFITGAVGLCI